MANTFKSNTKLNVGTDAVTSTNATVVTASGSSTLVLLSILLSNTSASSVQVDVALVKSGGADDTHLIKNAPVPAGSSLEIISGSKIINFLSGKRAFLNSCSLNNIFPYL